MGKIHWVAAALSLLFAASAHAQSYPTQPVKLIVPWPPGGGVDTSARIISQPLSERLGQSIVIDNRGGAGGNIGTELAARARPDGYTLLMGSVSPNAINVHLYPRLGFDPVKDLTPIVFVTTVPNILVVPGNAQANTALELIAHAKSNPGRVNYGSGGVGSSQHLATAMLIASTGINIVHVPYKGTSPAEIDLMAGHVSMLLDTTACLPFVAASRMKALAVASKARNPALPNVPTFDELGISGVYSSSWYGIMAPAGVPPEVVDRINTEVNAILKTPEMRKRLADFGGEVGGGSPADFAKFLASETARYADIVKASGAKVE
ncbi:MAG: tripartite tricarboxylate transporter substrate binding protein [Betaproteobacteria bacterium]|nr:tripartite tricarboxylate transporter substrate binding protein [Betaproteobacteria bacterium]